MLGIDVFLGHRSDAGRTVQQVPDGPLPSMPSVGLSNESTPPRPFHDVLALYAQANFPADAEYGLQRATRSFARTSAARVVTASRPGGT